MGRTKKQLPTAGERANLYKLLSLIYIKEPTQELLELLNEVGIRSAKRLEDLVIEYTRLFIGPGKHIHPYESVQRPGDTGQYWGESTVVVKKFIEAAGLQYQSSFTGMPDHLGVEFEFMGKLIEHEIEASQKQDSDEVKRSQQIQQKFFNEHLEQWAGQFCQKVKKEASLDFYKEAATLTENFLKQEKEGLNDG